MSKANARRNVHIKEQEVFCPKCVFGLFGRKVMIIENGGSVIHEGMKS